MNFDEAIKCHLEWKTMFHAAITKQEMVDADAIGKDNCCQLGQWLHREGKFRYAKNSEFILVVGWHKAFHAEAGKVAQLINVGKYAEAKLAIADNTPYSAASTSVYVAIQILRKMAG